MNHARVPDGVGIAVAHHFERFAGKQIGGADAFMVPFDPSFGVGAVLIRDPSGGANRKGGGRISRKDAADEAWRTFGFALSEGRH